MIKKRLLALPLSLALALAGASASMAQDPFDPSGVDEWNEDEAIVLYHQLETRLLAMGVPPEDMDAAISYVAGQLASLDEEDIEDLIEVLAAQGLMTEMRTEEEGEAVDIGDDEFLTEKDPEIDIDIGDDDEEEDEEE